MISTKSKGIDGTWQRVSITIVVVIHSLDIGSFFCCFYDKRRCVGSNVNQTCSMLPNSKSCSIPSVNKSTLATSFLCVLLANSLAPVASPPPKLVQPPDVIGVIAAFAVSYSNL